MTDIKDPEKEARHGLVGAGSIWHIKRQFQFEFLVARQLQPTHKLLDIGCGTLRGGIPLIDFLKPGNYFGIEARKEAIDAGLLEMAESGLEEKCPRLIEAHKFKELHLGEQFDFIWAFSVLFHMDDQTVAECIEFAKHHLAPSGRFFANVNIGDWHTGRWREFVLTRRPRTFYEELADISGLEVQDIGSLKELGHDLSSFAHLIKDPEQHHSQRMLCFQ